MKKNYSLLTIFWLISFFLFSFSQKAFATHAQSADITYQCLGGNQYQISVSFYRDCSGVNAPNTIAIDVASASCNQNFTTTLNQIPGTGVDVTPVCNTLNTVCNGGNYPGVEEYIYQGIVNLPANCTDWIFSFTLCCRNNAINTINNPGGENIYVEARLNNFHYACNNSPTFSNPPVSFPCVGQTSCFNHGAYDADGDSLHYTLIAPATGPNTAVTYIGGYSAQQPLISNPAVTFNAANGDICMTPTLQEVTVLAVRVEEWRDGIFIGSVVRDIQLRTVVCNNNLPTLSGINGTGVYNATVCAGNTLTFNIPSYDPDQNQTITINWNNAIPNASFTSNAAQLPTGVFSWTPTANDISPNPYCFTVTVSDDNCPVNGVQIYSFCITVTGFSVTTFPTAASCGLPNGSATVTPVAGVPPYTYQWLPNGGNGATANGLQAGQYTVNVTDANGCTTSDNVVIGAGSLPATIALTPTHVNCYGGNTGSITANVNGGVGPYNYLWSTGAITPAVNNLMAGTYWLTITTQGGCVSSDTITVIEPSSPITAITTKTDVTCFNGNDGSATVIPAGGTPPYTAVWNTIPQQNNLTANNLTSGAYSVTVTDNNGCNTTQNVIIDQPLPLTITMNQQNNVSCFGGNDGLLAINISGGNAPYTYNWNNFAFPNAPTITNLTAGVYLLNVTDANGCSINNQFTISQPNELILLTSQLTHVSCHGYNDGEIQTNTTGGTAPYNYSWIPVMGNQANASNLAPGTYSTIVTDNKGCIDTLTTTITEPTPITTTAMGADTICPGDQATISVTANGGVGNYNYLWNNNNTGATQQVSPASTTTYSVTATDANGCPGTTDSIVVLVNDINLATLHVVNDTNLCQGSPYSLSASVSGGIDNYVFNWSNGLGQGSGPFVVAPLSSTNYTVTVTDVCGNTVSENIAVDIHPLPKVNLLPQTAIECGSVAISLQNNSTNPSGNTYFWDFGDNTTSTSEMPTKTYHQTGNYQVELTVTSPYGCVNTDQAYVNITVHPKPIAQFETTPYEIDMLNPQVSFENYSVDADFYAWNFGDGSTSNQHSPVHVYDTHGTYPITLIATNTYGCKDTARSEVIIDPVYSFYIPNAFTPNNDGDNDIFTAVGEEIETFEMQIFNRWGELIYETSELTNGWDGTIKGSNELAMNGVYVYNIKLRDWQGLYHKYVGHVSLLK